MHSGQKTFGSNRKTKKVLKFLKHYYFPLTGLVGTDGDFIITCNKD